MSKMRVTFFVGITFIVLLAFYNAMYDRAPGLSRWSAAGDGDAACVGR